MKAPCREALPQSCSACSPPTHAIPQDDDYDYYGGLGGPAAAAVRQRVAGGGPGSGGAAEEVLLDVEAGGLLGGLFRVPFKPKLLEVLAAGKERHWEQGSDHVSRVGCVASL